LATIDSPKVSVRTGDEQFSIEPVDLANVELNFTIGEHSFTLLCRVVERMAPEPQVTLEYDGNPWVAMEREAIQSLVNSNGTEINASIDSGATIAEAVLYAVVPPFFGETLGSTKVQFYVSRDLTQQKSPQTMQEVSFCIINMHVITKIGHIVELERGFKQIGGTVLQDKEWTIQLRQIPHCNEATRFLRSVGGSELLTSCPCTKTTAHFSQSKRPSPRSTQSDCPSHLRMEHTSEPAELGERTPCGRLYGRTGTVTQPLGPTAKGRTPGFEKTALLTWAKVRP
jgi:hypothetical protein